MTVYEQIWTEVEKMPTIDTHEHLPPAEEYRDGTLDILKEYLMHYMSSDLVSAGLPRGDLEQVTDCGTPIEKRWEIVEPFWDYCRHTGYGRALDYSVELIYGIPKISRETIVPLNEKFVQANGRPGHFRHVLRSLCNIEISILDAFVGRFECDKALFRRVWQPQNYMTPMPSLSDAIERLESRYGLVVNDLSDWMDGFQMELADHLDHGVVALKNAHAYVRSLNYEKVDFETAKASFARALNRCKLSKSRSSVTLDKEVQDYMMHFILGVAEEKGLVVQFHTGLQEGNGNYLSNSDPRLLNNLFMEYPGVKFDIFHIGYPFQNITSALAKMFPNVYVDMCWAHIISPEASRRALSDYLDAVPYNKILGFGGDYLFVDGVCGHLRIAKENISRTLAEKVEQRVFSVERAIEIASRLLYTNAKNLFPLDDIR